MLFAIAGRLVVRAAHLALERRGRPAKEIYLPLTRPDRAPPGGAEASEIDIQTDVRRSGQLQALDCGAPEN